MGDRARYRHLLEDPDVSRWYRNLSRGSVVTAGVYLRRLGWFCSSRGTDPKGLLRLGDRELEDMLMDTVGELEERGRAGGYVKTVVKAVRSWLAHNHRQLAVRIRIRGAEETPTLREERVPTKPELLRILMAGNRKTRAACALLAFSGLRLEVLGNYRGTDGLRLRDLPELRVEGGKVRFEKVPAMVVVREELSKAGHRYLTFLCEEGCRYLAEYLEERAGRGEELGPDSPVITPRYSGKPFVTTTKISDAIRKAMRRAGFRWRPYVLRAYFDTQLMVAENAGRVIRDYRQFWMGHKGDMEARYTTNKHRLPPEVIEDMRGAYARCQEYLQTAQPEPSPDRMREEVRRQLLLIAGFTQDQIGGLDLAGMPDEEFQAMVRRKLLSAAQNGAPRQRVVPARELDRYLEKGWEFVAALPEGRVVLRPPAGVGD
jgi:hypothetical protein